MADQILRIAEVLRATGLGRSSLHRRVKAGDFPEPVRLGGPSSRAVGWLRSEIDDWIATRPRVAERSAGHRQDAGRPSRDGSSTRT